MRLLKVYIEMPIFVIMTHGMKILWNKSRTDFEFRLRYLSRSAVLAKLRINLICCALSIIKDAIMIGPFFILSSEIST